jgi:hypothetical protein
MHGELDDFHLDLTGTTPEELEAGINVPPGKYHAVILNAEEDRESKTRCIVLTFHTLAGTCPEGVDSVHQESLYLTEKNEKRVSLFAKRLGLITDADFGKQVRLNWRTAIGKQVVIEVVNDPYQEKEKDTGRLKVGPDGKPIMRDSSKLAFAGIWPAEDPRVAAVPRSAAPPKLPARAQVPRQPQQGELVGAANGHHGDPAGRSLPPGNSAIFDDV